MKTVLMGIAILGFICCSVLAAPAQERPAFCEKLADAFLGQQQAPYARQVAPDGSVYCEGLVRNPIALVPPSIVSVKQDQGGDSSFAPGRIATLTWCDESQEPVHVKLRSMSDARFALDAQHRTRFEWRTDLIATWQPNWKNLAALGIRETPLSGRLQDVYVPLRNGAGYSSSYSFVVQSTRPVFLTTALIQPTEPLGNPVVMKVSFSVVNVSFPDEPSKQTWITTIPFAKMKKGIYRITFEEGIDQAGIHTDPIYLLHKSCHAQ